MLKMEMVLQQMMSMKLVLSMKEWTVWNLNPLCLRKISSESPSLAWGDKMPYKRS
jgi:hypothetical protein